MTPVANNTFRKLFMRSLLFVGGEDTSIGRSRKLRKAELWMSFMWDAGRTPTRELQSAAMSTLRAPLLRFGSFEIDLESGELRKGGKRLKLPHQPFRVLEILASRPGEVRTRREIEQAIEARLGVAREDGPPIPEPDTRADPGRRGRVRAELLRNRPRAWSRTKNAEDPVLDARGRITGPLVAAL